MDTAPASNPPLRPIDFEPWAKGMLAWLKAQILPAIRDLAFFGDPRDPIPDAVAQAFTQDARAHIEQIADVAWGTHLRDWAHAGQPLPGPQQIETRAERLLSGALSVRLRTNHCKAGQLAVIRLVLLKPLIPSELLWSHAPGQMWLNECWKTGSTTSSAEYIARMLLGSRIDEDCDDAKAALEELDKSGPWQIQLDAFARQLAQVKGR